QIRVCQLRRGICVHVARRTAGGKNGSSSRVVQRLQQGGRDTLDARRRRGHAARYRLGRSDGWFREVIRLLAISGSLRAASTNAALLEAAARLAPQGLIIDSYDGLADLPHFNPDLDIDPPPAVVGMLRGEVAISEGLIISSPEYARGVPGALK